MRNMRKCKRLRNLFYCIILLFSAAPSSVYIYPFQEFKFRLNTEASRREFENKKRCASFLTNYFNQKGTHARNYNLEMLLENAFSNQTKIKYTHQKIKRNRFVDVLFKINMCKIIHSEDVGAGFLV